MLNPCYFSRRACIDRTRFAAARDIPVICSFFGFVFVRFLSVATTSKLVYTIQTIDEAHYASPAPIQTFNGDSVDSRLPTTVEQRDGLRSQRHASAIEVPRY